MRYKRSSCLFDGCKRKLMARGMCSTHYMRAMQDGSVAKYQRVNATSLEDAMRRYTPSGLGRDECWEWIGYRNEFGYGIVRSGGVRRRAHREALILSGVQVDPRMHVLHSCDNPPCVNPNHLRVGTPAENAADAAIRSRHKVKLSNDDVLRIRSLRGKMKQSEVAKMFGVTESYVSLIQIGRVRRHV